MVAQHSLYSLGWVLPKNMTLQGGPSLEFPMDVRSGLAAKGKKKIGATHELSLEADQTPEAEQLPMGNNRVLH